MSEALKFSEQIDKLNNVSISKKSKGSSGTHIQSGYFDEEYLSELTFRGGAYDVYDKMRRSDYQIQSILRAIYTPILSAKFEFIPLDNKDESQIQQAKFKNDVIKQFMTKGWGETLREILSYLVFGFAIFEPTFRVLDTKEWGSITTIRDLGFRKQDSIEEWDIDRDGNIKSVRQNITMSDHNLDVKIKGSEIIVFSNDKEGDNYEGVSILRASYPPYYRKNILLKLDIIGNEKMAIGTPIIYADQSMLNDTQEMSAIQSVMSSYTAHEKQYLILPDSLKDGGFDIQKGEYDSEAVNKSIDSADLAILKSVLQSFQAIGTQSMGGNAQNDGQMGMFLNSLSYIGSYICETLDPIIHQTYVMNFGEPEVKLDFKCSGINKKNLKEISEIISKYSQSKIIIPDDNIEEKIRSELDLPKIGPESNRESETLDGDQNKTDEKIIPTVGDQDKNEAKSEKSNDDKKGLEDACKPVYFLQNRELTEAEKSINLQAVESSFVKGEKEYEKIVNQYIEKMKNKFRVDLEKALKEKNAVKAVSNINIGFVSQLEKDLKSLIKNLVNVGVKQSASELNISKELQEDGVVKNVTSKIVVSARKIASDIADRFETASKIQAINVMEDGIEDEAVIAATVKSINDFQKSRVATAGKDVTVNKYINIGRNNMLFSNKNLVQGFQFSAILDGSTTDICQSLDKQILSPDDTGSFDLRPPLHFACRSILIPVLITQDPVKPTGLDVTPINGKSKSEVLKQKQFQFSPEDEVTWESISAQKYLESCKTGTEITKDGVKYIKDYDGRFRLVDTE